MTGAHANHEQHRFRALVVEDDEIVAQLVVDCLKQEGARASQAISVREALEFCGQCQFDLIVLDNRLPDGSGAMLFQQIHELQRDAVGIMLTAFPDLKQALKLTRGGLFEYLPKPFDLDAFCQCIQRAVSHLANHKSGPGPDAFTGSHPAILKARTLLETAGEHSSATVLLTGETGVGKELAAQIIHSVATRTAPGKSPLVALDCSAVPADLFEAELYGAEPGAYTGANHLRRGLVEAADQGTLFLDEIGEVPLPLQAKLLRFLETREYRRVGSSTPRKFTGRIISATNRDLMTEVEAGRFRADLWYRLDIFSIHIPPLRERRSDLPSLTESLLSQVAAKYRRAKPFLRGEDLEQLSAYSFPGNIRELRNILERSLLLTPDDSPWLQLDTSRLSHGPRKGSSAPTPTPPSRSDTPAEPAPPTTLSPLDAQEYSMFKRLIDEERGVVTEVAKRLGITRQAVYRRLKKWPSLKVANS